MTEFYFRIITTSINELFSEYFTVSGLKNVKCKTDGILCLVVRGVSPALESSLPAAVLLAQYKAIILHTLRGCKVFELNRQSTEFICFFLVSGSV